MAYSVSEYLKMFLSLFPRGRAWSRDVNSVLYKLSNAHAEELTRIDIRSGDLLIERDTRKTYDLLTDHERDLGLPDECSSVSSTITERRSTAFAKFVSEGGLNKQAYIDLAEDLGFTITITEFKPFWCGLGVSGEGCGNQSNIFYWQVNTYINPDDWIYFTSGSSQCGDMLSVVAGTVEQQCVLNKHKPAHTIIIFEYFGPEYSAAFSGAFNSLPSSDQAWLQGAFDRSFDNSFTAYYGGGEFDKPAFDEAFYKPL
ncbi:hypothetical protein A2619_05770 [candidate division WWE3 bacterium RIFOXYD1_FULL_39_9]|uniref:Uncharacterized protein n=1 Tax=candidate division WWE3 bacterium RIFOXYD1_FULL_39_9 TaxID=1802649 RepID=A0A1F4X3R4_UNCKA|nr:MAG: hypothetical protein A2619_05770 [candidate division WWE3 bacterium RIFOXYD1_FULL_39_9]